MSLMDMLKVEEPEVKEKKAVKPKLKKEVTEKTQQPAEGKAEQPKAKGRRRKHPERNIRSRSSFGWTVSSRMYHTFLR